VQLQRKKTKITNFFLNDYIKNLDFTIEDDFQEKKDEKIGDFKGNSSVKHEIQKNSMDFDINSYFDDNFGLNHIYIVKAFKIIDISGNFLLKLINFSFYWKNAVKSLIKFECKERENMIEMPLLGKNDSIIVRFHKKKEIFVMILNKNQEIAVFIDKKHEEMMKIDGILVKSVKKCLDSRFIHDFLIILTSDLRVLAFNLQGESVFFLEKAIFISNSFKIPSQNEKFLINSVIFGENAFLMKNEAEVSQKALFYHDFMIIT